MYLAFSTEFFFSLCVKYEISFRDISHVQSGSLIFFVFLMKNCRKVVEKSNQFDFPYNFSTIFLTSKLKIVSLQFLFLAYNFVF